MVIDIHHRVTVATWFIFVLLKLLWGAPQNGERVYAGLLMVNDIHHRVTVATWVIFVQLYNNLACTTQWWACLLWRTNGDWHTPQGDHVGNICHTIQYTGMHHTMMGVSLLS